LLGIGVGALTILPFGSGDCAVCYGENGVEVPREFWEIAWDGEPPEVTSPWGESYRPVGRSIYPGSRAVVYLPFETISEHSSRFLALQANRAVGAVHGEKPYTDLQIAEDPDNPLVETIERRGETGSGIPLEASIGKEMPQRARSWLWGTLCLIWFCNLVALPWMLQFRPTRYRKLFAGFFYGLIGCWGVLLGLYILGPLFGIIQDLAPLNVPLVLLRYAAQRSPLDAAGLWALVGVSSAFFYCSLYLAFRGIEAPLGKVRPVWKEYG